MKYVSIGFEGILLLKDLTNLIFRSLFLVN